MRYDPARIGVALINSDPKQLAKDRQFLTKLGFASVHQHAGFGEARPFLSSGPIQLILTGDKAGDIDGVDCIRVIKRDKELTGKAVVMVSADGRRDRVLAAISAGCGGYVLRPYAQDTFAKHLKNAWESTRPDDVGRGEPGIEANRLGRQLDGVVEPPHLQSLLRLLHEGQTLG